MKIIFIMLTLISQLYSEEFVKSAQYDGRTSGPLYYPALKQYCQQNDMMDDYRAYMEFKSKADELSRKINLLTDASLQKPLIDELNQLNLQNIEKNQKLYHETRKHLHQIVVTKAGEMKLFIIEDYDNMVRGMPKDEYKKYISKEMVDITNDVKPLLNKQ
jgi:hypothetical protein